MRSTLVDSAESMLKRLRDLAHFDVRILREFDDVRRHARAARENSLT